MESGQYVPPLTPSGAQAPDDGFVGTLTLSPEFLKPSVHFYGGINQSILTVTHGGEFQWAENADELIAGMKDSSTSDRSIYHVLTRLRAYDKLADSIKQQF